MLSARIAEPANSIENGRYVVQFENGKSLPIRSSGELTLATGADGKPQIRGRMGVNEYVEIGRASCRERV